MPRGRPRKNPLPETGVTDAIDMGETGDEAEHEINRQPELTSYIEKKKILIKTCHLAIGVDLLGSKTSLSSNVNNELELLPFGIRAYSKKSNRTVIIPFTNIKGFELFAE